MYSPSRSYTWRSITKITIRKGVRRNRVTAVDAANPGVRLGGSKNVENSYLQVNMPLALNNNWQQKVDFFPVRGPGERPGRFQIVLINNSKL